MLAVKIRYDRTSGKTDTLYFLTLSETDGRQIAGKIGAKMQEIVDENTDHKTALNRLVDWCTEEFGERPHKISTEEVRITVPEGA